MQLGKSCRVNGCNTPLGPQNKGGYCRHHRDQSLHRRYRLFRRQPNSRLSFKEFCRIVEPGVCSYCGGPLGLTGHGIDRLDPNKPYIKKNVVACCGTCNMLKGNHLNPEETQLIIDFLKKFRDTNVLWGNPPNKPRRKNGTKRRKRKG